MKLAVNEKNALHLMKATFSSGLTFLTEAMQNARRAGASMVSFTVKSQEDDGITVTIQDDGEGVRDFYDLMTVAQSGWGEEIQITDKPFGAGFLSIIACCDSGIIESNGTRMFWNTKDLFEGGLAIIEADDSIGTGTRITLQGVCRTTTLNGHKVYDEDIRHYIDDRCKGFEIPVYLNGSIKDNCESSHRATVSVDVEGLGTLCFFSGTYARRPDTVRCYLQGLPINRSERHREGTLHPLVLHLDSQCFEARMPDREQTVSIDQPTIQKRATAQYPKLAEKLFRHLSGRLREETAFWFVMDHAKHLVAEAVELPAKLFEPYIKGQAGADYQPCSDRSESYFGYQLNEDCVDADLVKELDMVILEQEFRDTEEYNDIFASIVEMDAGRKYFHMKVASPAEVAALPAWLPKPVNNSTTYSDDTLVFKAVEREDSFAARIDIPGFCKGCSVIGNLAALQVDWYTDDDEEDRKLIASAVLKDSWYDYNKDVIYLVNTDTIPSSVLTEGDSFVNCEDEYNMEIDYDEVERALNIANINLKVARSPNGAEGAGDDLKDFIEQQLKASIDRSVWKMLNGKTLTVSVTVDEDSLYDHEKLNITLT